MKCKMKNLINKYIPGNVAVALVLMFLFNLLTYYGARGINLLLGRSYIDMTTAWDRYIPVLPGFIFIYLLAFPFWYGIFFLRMKRSPGDCYRIAAAELLGELVCLIIFIIVPSTNSRPVVESRSFASWTLNLIYSLDKPDNLFPSIHCLESWLCYAIVRDDKDSSARFKLIAFTGCLLICLSTLFTRQHALPDVAGGIVIAEIVWQLSPVYKKSADRILGKLADKFIR